jgi:hypothetical protein
MLKCKIGVCPAYSAPGCRLRRLHQIRMVPGVTTDIGTDLNGMV